MLDLYGDGTDIRVILGFVLVPLRVYQADIQRQNSTLIFRQTANAVNREGLHNNRQAFRQVLAGDEDHRTG